MNMDKYLAQLDAEEEALKVLAAEVALAKAELAMRERRIEPLRRLLQVAPEQPATETQP